MQVLRLLAAPRRGVALATTITAPPTASPDDSKAVDAEEEEEEYDDDDDDDDEGSFFELDLSVRASSSSASSGSSSSDDASLTDLDFVISLHRSRSASPSFFHSLTPPPLLKPGAGTPPPLRTLSFARATAASASGTRSNAALYDGRRSSFARSSARSLRLFMESPADDADPEREPRRAPSRDVIRRYLTKITTRLRRSVRPRHGGEGVAGLRRLRKSRSASAAVTTASSTTTAASRRDDSLAEKQDGIASAIAHCKESLHRAASLSDCGLPRSRSDPGREPPSAVAYA